MTNLFKYQLTSTPSVDIVNYHMFAVGCLSGTVLVYMKLENMGTETAVNEQENSGTDIGNLKSHQKS